MAADHLARHSPSGLPSDVKVAGLRHLIKRFPPQEASVVARTYQVWRIGPQTRSIPARRRRFSAQQTGLSCRFGSVCAADRSHVYNVGARKRRMAARVALTCHVPEGSMAVS